MNRADFAQLLGGARSDSPSAAVVEAAEPAKWRQAFADAAGGRGPVFLSNPDWGNRERAEFAALINRPSEDWDPERGWLMIPSGGSSGRIKLARHDQFTLLAAVRGYQSFFNESAVSAVGVLPLHHVGGLMGWLRSALTGSEFVDGEWQRIKDQPDSRPSAEGKTISLVPTQLKTLLEHDAGVDWLRSFTRVLIGGASMNTTLAQRARHAGVKLVRTYGATETAAMVAAGDGRSESPGDIQGLKALSPASIRFDDQGQIEVRGDSVCRGYWPDKSDPSPVWRSGDLGRFIDEDRIQIIGRADDLIITGGEKVNPLEVESVLQSLVGDERVAVLGLPDSKWGQQVVAVFHPDVQLDLNQLKERGQEQLAPFKWPKQAYVCDPWPVNALGKLNRSKLRAAIESA